MKTRILVLLLVFIQTLCPGQTINQEDVPAPVLKAMENKYPDMKKVNWEKEADKFEAEFKVEKKKVSVLFDAGGQWLQTETELSKSELPQSVIKFLDKEYPGFKLEEACLIKTSTNETMYELEVEKGKSELEITVSENGTALKTEEEKDEKEGKDD